MDLDRLQILLILVDLVRIPVQQVPLELFRIRRVLLEAPILLLQQTLGVDSDQILSSSLVVLESILRIKIINLHLEDLEQTLQIRQLRPGEPLDLVKSRRLRLADLEVVHHLEIMPRLQEH